MRKRGFTLIELLIIVAIIGTMLAVAVGNLVSGMGNAELSAGGRTVLQLARHARALALLKQRPCVVTYYDAGPGEGRTSKITLEVGGDAERGGIKSNVRHVSFTSSTLEGDDEGESDEKSELGELMDRVEESFKAIRLKVEILGEDGKVASDRGKGTISVFSNADYLLQQSRAVRMAVKGDSRDDEDDGKDGEKSGADSEGTEEPVPVIFETNGRTQAHRVILYRDGSDPERDGVKIKVDIFGKVEVEDDE